MQPKRLGIFSLPVIVGALGFFVDVYDLLLYNIIRVPSLRDLGLSDEAISSEGKSILSIQMIGLVLGGIAWGIMGDKKGRKSVLFGSILLYSLATIANGFVTNVHQYAWLRFIAALGLAGELGASITMVNEMLPKEKRGIAASIIATTGVLGTVSAYFIYHLSNGDWRLCYYIGGGMGLLLLLLRVSIMESGIYERVKHSNVSRGNFLMFFTNKDRFFRYLRGILIGLPVWYVIGILITFANDFGSRMGIKGVDAGTAVMYQYVGLAFGDLCAGFISNLWKSRKKTLFLFYGILIIFIALYFSQDINATSAYMYWLCVGLGFGSGISVLYITMSAEQFGTNLRATAAISIPNVVRGGLPLMLALFGWLQSFKGLSYVTAGCVTGAIVMLIAILAASFMKESYSKDMNFIEE